MAHFAILDDANMVTNVVTVDNEDVGNLEYPASEAVGIEFLSKVHGSPVNCKQTSYNNNFRFRYAIIGGFYIPEHDVFVPEKPYPSWVLDITEMDWWPPIPYPDDTELYEWDEQSRKWATKQ